MTMQWMDENSKDVEMLKRIDLSPLTTDPAKGNENLFKQVQRHNKSLSDLAERFEKLARDREELERTDQWFDHESKAVMAERRRVVAESWDVLVTLRKLLQDRRDVLQQMQDHIVDQIDSLEEQYNQVLDSARKTLSRQHREYLESEPVHGPAWIEQQAENDNAVAAVSEQIVPLRSVLGKLQTLYHRVGPNSALTFRQREMFEQLN